VTPYFAEDAALKQIIHKSAELLRSVLFDLIFYPFAVLWAASMFLCLVIPGTKVTRHGVMFFCKTVLWLLRNICDIKVEIRGSENFSAQPGAYVIASKHMSDLDAIALYTVAPELTALAKTELFKLPFIGSLLRRMEVARIDRKSGTAHKQMPSVLDHVLKNKRPLLIFPKGTRSAPMERKELKSGVFHTQKDGRICVVPVATNSGVYWRGLGCYKRAGTAVYDIGKTIHHTTSRTQFMRSLNSEIIEKSENLM